MRLQSLARRTTPMMVVGYLIQVESDAYSIADDRHANRQTLSARGQAKM
jgi:hypothetical protein